MDDEITVPSPSSLGPNLTWQTKALIVGGVIGASAGVAAAYLLSQRSKDGQPPQISVGEGVKIGVLVLSLLRSIGNL